MNIAPTSYSHAPNVGGIETVSNLWAEGFRARGHQVQVISFTPAAVDCGPVSESGPAQEPASSLALTLQNIQAFRAPKAAALVRHQLRTRSGLGRLGTMRLESIGPSTYG